MGGEKKEEAEHGRWGEAEWEQWGEDFARRMAERFHSPPWERKRRSIGIGTTAIALFILAWGTVWLGNELGWWSYNFPFWPIVIILAGLAILLGQVKRLF